MKFYFYNTAKEIVFLSLSLSHSLCLSFLFSIVLKKHKISFRPGPKENKKQKKKRKTYAFNKYYHEENINDHKTKKKPLSYELTRYIHIHKQSKVLYTRMYISKQDQILNTQHTCIRTVCNKKHMHAS